MLYLLMPIYEFYMDTDATTIKGQKCMKAFNKTQANKKIQTPS